MLPLASIIAQIGAADQQIAMTKLKLEEKKEELRRLKAARTELATVKSDFLSKKRICLEPNFTSKTFHGENSNTYDDFREGELEVSFETIPNDQVTTVDARMMRKAIAIEKEIENYRTILTAQEANRITLLAMRSEVSK
ncbi:DUF5082 domain-containing protein [Cerasibacillus terrae]|uniref:DUF5082 domain-containing protein n=1 Tax=Cerasibacillus terrae TaxID=2498845 RepID=A0A5C8P021_9BACI|nr:DUF5082 family protein [Cerasibacillus terrae]TXL66721.1 DUF5082 domain-containing protein [Cerasibacillus terrae]